MSHRRITSSPLPTSSPTISLLPYNTDSAAMSAFERALPLALTVFCGVIGGYYTFQPVFAPDALRKDTPSQSAETKPEPPKNPAPASK
ncbi:hypothetical protein BGZ61DRAFT_444064 [Ilyonectria robusta]|uniref:uncharacterized protein n=1 Tax=Ilyonectria robusta TaxID=1079257 RepID=UPI001E8CED3B|nr:uncharacterized protein BGZ61DRAFT_444064 [Ilyonectria robusta]KAH8735319.1 hypothetical protein BGZ61DRAFT_444064 [Ilyonectria robusta]